MYIIHIASEFAPLAKVGGLADVLHGLSKELLRQGHHIEVILPKYDCLHFTELKSLKVEFRELWSSDGTQRYNNTVWSAVVDDVKVILIEPHHPQYYFTRGVIYGCHDDIDRFVYFCRTAMEYLFKSGKTPDVIHSHDWPTALVPVLFKEMYVPLGFKTSHTVLSLHNLEHQGRCQPFNLTKIGLQGENYLQPEKMQDPYSPSLINLLKGGIIWADHLITVSPTYEQEIQTVEGGFGLQDVLIQQRKKLTGILNGIDENYWNPQSDPHLPIHYETHNIRTQEQLNKVVKAKAENKRQLYARLRLKEEDQPLIVSITRLTAQKAPHLIKHALLQTVEKGGHFILLGSALSAATTQEFEQLKQQIEKTHSARIILEKNEALAHLLFASSDLFIIPSLFEPCGLTQMIALRYGSIPIARKTGGLADTVFDIDTSSVPLEKRNGFTFDFADTQGVSWALERALNTFKHDKNKWRTLLLHGMALDFSWKHAVKDYLTVYENLLLKREASSAARKGSLLI